MAILYNCHTDGDNWRITKFNDGEVESSYLCSESECQCPAGSRPICRHRLMLPMFLNRGAVDTFWFLDFERKGWVSNEPALSYIGDPPGHTDLMVSPESIDKFLDSERSELGSSNLEPAYGIGPMITNAIPLIEADNERTRLRNLVYDVDKLDLPNDIKVLRDIKPSWRRI